MAIGRHAAFDVPRSPRERQARESLGPAVRGQRVEEGVARGIGALARRAERARRGREQDECREVQVFGQLVKMPSRVDLRSQDPGQALCGE